MSTLAALCALPAPPWRLMAELLALCSSIFTSPLVCAMATSASNRLAVPTMILSSVGFAVALSPYSLKRGSTVSRKCVKSICVCSFSFPSNMFHACSENCASITRKCSSNWMWYPKAGVSVLLLRCQVLSEETYRLTRSTFASKGPLHQEEPTRASHRPLA